MGISIDVWEDGDVHIDEVAQYNSIIFSPGPGLPSETHAIFPVLERYATSKKILGVCLGMQGIASFFGAELYNQREVKHGVSEKVIITNDSLLLKDVPAVFDVGLYHSWAVKLNERLPLTEIAHSEHGVTMALKHQTLPIYGVQFHPESILTPEGKKIVSNFIFNC
jgi:anthranilate synthase/aminodeoxychorismate synthase-like glutamine amidotransferase